MRDNPHAREAIADGFELIAGAMEPCVDCGQPEPVEPMPLPVLDMDALAVAGV